MYPSATSGATRAPPTPGCRKTPGRPTWASTRAPAADAGSCTPTARRLCWTGPSAARGQGVCRGRRRDLLGSGTWGPCEGQILPDCAGRVCGSNGCGGSCGNCLQGEVCDDTGRCGTPVCGASNFTTTCPGGVYLSGQRALQQRPVVRLPRRLRRATLRRRVLRRHVQLSQLVLRPARPSAAAAPSCARADTSALGGRAATPTPAAARVCRGFSCRRVQRRRLPELPGHGLPLPADLGGDGARWGGCAHRRGVAVGRGAGASAGVPTQGLRVPRR
jgi:hypothetical protein